MDGMRCLDDYYRQYDTGRGPFFDSESFPLCSLLFEFVVVISLVLFADWALRFWNFLFELSLGSLYSISHLLCSTILLRSARPVLAG